MVLYPKQTPPRVPSVVITALQETASRFGGSEPEFVVTAATWAFCRQDAMTRRLIVDYFWFRGLSELKALRARAETSSTS